MIIKKMAVGNSEEAFIEENFINGVNVVVLKKMCKPPLSDEIK